MQRALRTSFALPLNASVLYRKTLLLWISSFQATESTPKRKSPGRPQTVRTPRKVAAVTAAIHQSSKRFLVNMPQDYGQSLRRSSHSK